MFDDYVEHASSAPTLSPPTRSLPQLQYEGFEASPYDEDERGDYYGTSDAAITNVWVEETPIFQLGRVQYTLPAPLVHLSIASNVLTMALRSNVLHQLELSRENIITTITLPSKKSSPADSLTMYKIFNDPTGKHLLITTEQGDNFYCYDGWTRARQLNKLRMVVEAVAWNTVPLTPAASASYPKTSTREILLGARNGTIYEALLDAHDDFFKSQDRYVQPVFSLPEKQPVTGIKFECSSGRRAFVLITTPTRLYQFSGLLDKKSDDTSKLFDGLFAPYRENAPKFLELGGSISYSELHLFASFPPPALSKTMAWLTASGIYHGALNINSSSSEVIESPSLLPYPSSSATSGAVPISIESTEFHFLTLYRDRICAVSNLDEQLVYEELLPLRPDEKALGMASDPVRKTYWVFTNLSLFELLIKDEDRDVWNIYLQKGTYDLALQFAKTAPHRFLINASLADYHFKEGRYIQAAQAYAQSSKSFEEVALAFGDVGERDALRYFLVCKLERMSKVDLTQRMMLATWLVEFYLSKLNTLDDVIASEGASHDVDNLLAERTLIEDELRQFFETYKTNLEKHTTYELILSHGRTDMFLKYALVIGDYQRVIEHYVMEEEWVKAVDVLNRQSDLELYYRFSPVLMRNAPKEIVDSWLKQPLLDPHRLIPSLLQIQHIPPSPLSPNHAVRYLQSVVFTNGSTSPMIHNLLLTLLISSPSSSSSTPPDIAGETKSTPAPALAENDLPLLRFLSTAPTDPITSQPYYDLDYALRLCKQYGRLQACVHIYDKMSMWEESVDLALEMGELDLAKINADRPEDDEVLRKKLWLKVAKYVVQDKKDIKTAMQFLDNTSVLKIEDILPFFPDFVVIDDFKEEICTALEGYSAHIDSLKEEMDEATRSAESIKKEITELKNRFVTLEQGERCSVCDFPLLLRQFYVFPCQHSFHADCLIGLVKEYLPAHALRRILTLQNELLRISSTPHERTVQQSPSLAPTPGTRSPAPQQPQRALLSANFVPNGGAALNNGLALARSSVVPLAATGRVFAAAGAGLRDLIIPESLASAIGVGSWGGGRNRRSGKEGKEGKERKGEKLREELDDLLASSCPLCESVVAGLDKAFIALGEEDKSWQL